jgi:hypothetical protein
MMSLPELKELKARTGLTSTKDERNCFNCRCGTTKDGTPHCKEYEIQVNGQCICNAWKVRE